MCIHSFDGKSIQMELVSEIAWNTFAQHSQQNQSSTPLWTSSAHITALEITFNGWENARILFELVILWYNCGRQTKFNDKLSYARVFFLVFYLWYTSAEILDKMAAALAHFVHNGVQRFTSNPKDLLAGLLLFFFSSNRRSAVLKFYKSWYETLFFADRAVIAAILNSLDILLFRSVIRYTADNC